MTAPQDDVHLRGETFILKLYVTGYTAHSVQAIAAVRHLCEKYLEGRFNLEVIDIRRQPAALDGETIVVAPTLVKIHPLPLCKIVGDMSDERMVLAGLGLNRWYDDAAHQGESV